jgi:programmed cell death protein 5
MSGNPDDDRMEELRQERMEELRERQQGQGGEGNEEAARADAQKDAILKQYLTDGARQRLNAVEMSKPEFAEQVKEQLVAVAQSGRLQDRIDEDQMRDLLDELKPDSKSFNIRRR